MKKNKILSSFLLVILLYVWVCPAFAADSSADGSGLGAPPELTLDVKAAYLMDLDTGETLFELNDEDAMYPASTTKIMTCYLALKNLNPDDTITIPEGIMEGVTEGASTAYLQAGEQMTVYELLECLMIVSANEAANAVAILVSGSIADFVNLMNQEAESLGCTGTHFANTNGLHDENHYTTAADMAKIAAAAMESDTFRSICSTAQVTIPATNLSGERTLSTTNYMLPGSANPGYAYEGTIGIKTGFTTPAGCCLVAACTKDGRTLLSVVFGAQKTYDENGVEQVGSFPQTQALMDWGFINYETITAYQAALNAPPEESPAPTASPEESAAEDEAAVSAAPEASDAPSAQVSASAQQETEEESSGVGHVFGTLLLLVAIIIVVLLLLIVLFLLIMMLKRG